ncbi:DUF6362 family protein [Gluconobacter cerinus]|uniref:DUF6362 domain-containing protein n=1 Tax=Gluconobacter cerinus TaxID=38307 RepID=A0AAV5NBM7_9PROT|nr:DUF6362 family protein [Gluconobacter cerinus]GBR03191.1 hypothetical protein AA0229_1883 [Gluconobacter cerinus NRIC 0229]GLQ61564.1 hypothetical protein GCM10007867_04090 [Gluconobacter cerinus]
MKKVKRINLAQDIPAQVEQWLDDAAYTLAALPASGCRPGGLRAYWPEMVPDREDLDWPLESDLKPPPPSSDEIERMDCSLEWLGLLADENRILRPVVNMRLIVHPMSGQHQWTWRKIGRKLGIGHETAKARHHEACRVIARKIVLPEFFSRHYRHFERM